MVRHSLSTEEPHVAAICRVLAGRFFSPGPDAIPSEAPAAARTGPDRRRVVTGDSGIISTWIVASDFCGLDGAGVSRGVDRFPVDASAAVLSRFHADRFFIPTDRARCVGA